MNTLGFGSFCSWALVVLLAAVVSGCQGTAKGDRLSVSAEGPVVLMGDIAAMGAVSIREEQSGPHGCQWSVDGDGTRDDMGAVIKDLRNRDGSRLVGGIVLISNKCVSMEDTNKMVEELSRFAVECDRDLFVYHATNVLMVARAAQWVVRSTRTPYRPACSSDLEPDYRDYIESFPGAKQ